jgi:hypothetical protein
VNGLGGVRHYKRLERLQEGDARVLASTATPRALIIRFGLQSDTHALDANGVAGPVEQDAGHSDPTVVPPSDKPREKI